MPVLMIKSERLHLYARRLCYRRFGEWVDAYANLTRAGGDREGVHYTASALRIFPRYNVDQAVLEAVERFNADALPPLEALRSGLLLATAAPVSGSAIGDIDRLAMAEERAFLADAIRRWEPRLPDEEPLPYRRVLTREEYDAIHGELTTRWGAVAGRLYPMEDLTDPSLVALRVSSFDAAELAARLQRALKSAGQDRVFELREWGSSYEIDTVGVDFAYNGAEGTWTARNADWIVYCSHENTITFGGSIVRLLSAAEKALAPDWGSPETWR